METLLRDEIEEKARAEMQAQIMAEARLAAKAELEERLREERETLQKAEMEVRIQAEKAARERADQEAKLRAEAEARAAAESARAREGRGGNAPLRRLEARAREEAEAAAREKAETASIAARERAEAAARLDAERKAKIEAEARAMVEAEESERREKELAAKVDAERKAREEAEMRARIEARARETVEETTREKVKAEIEGDMTRRAEIEGKAQAKAYMQAKQQAELDEDARMRTEQARKAREIADVLRTKVEPDAEEAATPVRRRPRKKVNWVRNIAVGLAGGPGDRRGPAARGAAARRRRQAREGHRRLAARGRVSISNLKFSLFPTPHLKIEGLAVGKLLDAKASQRPRVPGHPRDPGRPRRHQLAGARRRLHHGRRARGASFRGARSRARAPRRRSSPSSLADVKLDVKPELKPFDAHALLRPRRRLQAGEPRRARASWNATVRPRDAEYDVTFSARNWELPMGAPVPVSDVSAKGVLTANDLTVLRIRGERARGQGERHAQGQLGAVGEARLRPVARPRARGPADGRLHARHRGHRQVRRQLLGGGRVPGARHASRRAAGAGQVPARAKAPFPTPISWRRCSRRTRPGARA